MWISPRELTRSPRSSDRMTWSFEESDSRKGSDCRGSCDGDELLQPPIKATGDDVEQFLFESPRNICLTESQTDVIDRGYLVSAMSPRMEAFIDDDDSDDALPEQSNAQIRGRSGRDADCAKTESDLQVQNHSYRNFKPVSSSTMSGKVRLKSCI